mmetsp:Transcript_616/g.870  ORF Transcript_616/g.870 Transcript_616/m.870 type:complete len:208 (+) Transcript_616:16-639(+)|eukprot:CAMPEP_0196245022 /NCGR_PEP_ID=MMETSP0913-20130531/32133_1 /TAXON_ID=49265 /ORGANISM="Thalassiosira rotula, Strain GSO102" /LENGTH=207 /DNA_ID=CAMNT_0041529147 /DNA_START=13 /DNA_END=636 /DNA_ORIENTATION=+
MALTDEQRKRMEENRKRALEIKRKKQLEKKEKEMVVATASVPSSVFDAGGFVGKSPEEKIELQSKKRRIEDVSSKDAGDGKMSRKHVGDTITTRNFTGNSNTTDQNTIEDDESSLEDFEIDASPHISQTEAQRTYCVPMGTLAVCAFIEKENPRQRGWNKMKLYDRAEVRRRARKRFGGKGGLQAERDKRKKKRFEKDLKETKDVFR